MHKETKKERKLVTQYVDYDTYICDVCKLSFPSPDDCGKHEKLHVKPIYESDQYCLYHFDNQEQFKVMKEQYDRNYGNFINYTDFVFTLPGIYCFYHDTLNSSTIYGYYYWELLKTIENSIMSLTQLLSDIRKHDALSDGKK